MTNILPDNDVAILDKREASHRMHWPRPVRCSVCAHATWFRPIALREPVGAPEPRQLWVLCHQCHDLLLVEMRRSPVRSPLRLRIAIGILASERSPQAYVTSTHVHDQRIFVFIIWVLIIAMLLHLVFILLLVGFTR